MSVYSNNNPSLRACHGVKSQAAEIDSAYFAEHPTHREYVRKVIPGEFGSQHVPDWIRYTLVERFRDGSRLRRPAHPVFEDCRVNYRLAAVDGVPRGW
jgi:hypothetical protein